MPVTLAALALAALDIVGTYFAAEWIAQRKPWLLVAGVSAFVALWVVYALALRWSTMTVVTFGWIVLLSIAVVVLDVLRYGSRYGPDVWACVAVLMIAQSYLVVRTGTA